MAITYGIDLTTATSYTTSYLAYFITPLYRIGSALQPFKITEMEISLVKPLRTGEGIKVEYRTNLTDNFVEVITIDYATYGGILSKNTITEKPKNIKESELIQLRFSLTGGSTSPEIQNINLK